MKKYTAPSYDARPNAVVPLPDHCEIPGCLTLTCGRKDDGTLIRKAGKADVFVPDRYGITRGVCCEHYHRIAAAHGDLANPDLRAHDGSYDPEKVREHWASAMVDKAAVIQRSTPAAPKGLETVLDQLHIAQPHSDAPDWSDRPW